MNSKPKALSWARETMTLKGLDFALEVAATCYKSLPNDTFWANAFGYLRNLKVKELEPTP